MIGVLLVFLLVAGAVAYAVTAWEEYGEYGPSEQWRYEVRQSIICTLGLAAMGLVILL